MLQPAIKTEALTAQGRRWPLPFLAAGLTDEVFATAMGLFGLASLLCGLANSLGMLVFARILQGLAGGPLMPLSQSLLLRIFPPRMAPAAIGLWSMTTLIAPVLGPIVGGWICDEYTWHWIFLINVPVGLVGCAATMRYMPGVAAPTVARFDLAGYLMLAFGMVALSLALDGLASLGLRQASVLVLMIFGLASLVAYGCTRRGGLTRCFRPGCSRWTPCASGCWAICLRGWAARACRS